MFWYSSILDKCSVSSEQCFDKMSDPLISALHQCKKHLAAWWGSENWTWKYTLDLNVPNFSGSLNGRDRNSVGLHFLDLVYMKWLRRCMQEWEHLQINERAAEWPDGKWDKILFSEPPTTMYRWLGPIAAFWQLKKIFLRYTTLWGSVVDFFSEKLYVELKPDTKIAARYAWEDRVFPTRVFGQDRFTRCFSVRQGIAQLKMKRKIGDVL